MTRPILAYLAVFMLCLPPSATASPCLDIAVVSEGAGWQVNLDVVDKLMETGILGSVELVGTSQYPFTSNQYDSLFILFHSPIQAYGESSYATRIRVGNELSGFIESGGGVVLAQTSIDEDHTPTASFQADHLPLLSGGDCQYGADSNVLIEITSEHPVFSSVDTLLMGPRTRTSCGEWTLHPNATVEASLPDGRPFVVTNGSVVALNIFPASDDINTTTFRQGYPADSDMPRLFANALVWSAGFDPATACNGDYDDDGLSDEEERDLGTDFQRADSDADGISDGIDNCPTIANASQVDTNNDGVGDACEPDQDNDGVDDDVDNCPDIANPDQADQNSDGTGDACSEPAPEPDSDDDGVPDTLDNCPDVCNPDQADDDGDNIGDACDLPSSRICSAIAGPVGALPFGLVLTMLLIRRRRRE